MKIGIYGGTFSPVHNGHVRAAKLFLQYISPDRLIIMPAGIPPHKQMDIPVSCGLRLEMCKAAFEEISERVEISDFEMNRKGKSYTVETVEHFSELGQVFVLCGEDMICSLDTWYRAGDLMQMAEFVAIAREEGGTRRVFEAAERLRREYGARITVIDERPLEISSTAVRNALKNGEDVSDLVPSRVIDIINENGLYR